MKFVPDYTVSYRGVFHLAGVLFNIDPKDVEMMEPHGTVIRPPPEPVAEQAPPKRRRKKHDAT